MREDLGYSFKTDICVYLRRKSTWLNPSPMNDNELLKPLQTFSDLLIAWRTLHNYSQASLAKEIGTHQAKVSQWEKGLRLSEVEDKLSSFPDVTGIGLTDWKERLEYQQSLNADRVDFFARAQQEIDNRLRRTPATQLEIFLVSSNAPVIDQSRIQAIWARNLARGVSYRLLWVISDISASVTEAISMGKAQQNIFKQLLRCNIQTQEVEPGTVTHHILYLDNPEANTDLAKTIESQLNPDRKYSEVIVIPDEQATYTFKAHALQLFSRLTTIALYTEDQSPFLVGVAFDQSIVDVDVLSSAEVKSEDVTEEMAQVRASLTKAKGD